jgi:signal transduction histidine kinase
MPATPSLPELKARVRSLVLDPWGRRRPWLHLAADLGLAGYGALLWVSGYAPSRVAAVVAVVALWAVLHVVDVTRSRSSRYAGVFAESDALEWAMLVTGFFAAGASGGIHSPLVPGVVAALPLRLFRTGWTRSTKGFWAVTGLGVAALAVLPQAVTGPPVSHALYGVVAGVGVGIVAMATVLYVALLTRVGHESIRAASLAREELMLQAMARARDLEQLGAKLSHELRNPLSSIKTLVQLSARSTSDPESREQLEVVEGEIRRMQQVLEDYLSFARPLENLRTENLRLSAVADDVVALLSGQAANAGVSLRCHGDGRVVGDPLRLKEALLNLVVNAIQASPRGGRVEVEIAEEGDAVRARVRDTGRGMAEEVLARIGTPFFTTREEGTGLGVALARATMVRHGGTLEYESRPGEGTVAIATLPAAARRTDGARARGG